MSLDIVSFSLDTADIWVASDHDAEVDYSYGGTRMVSPSMKDAEVHTILQRLMLYESTMKNQLINLALRRNVLENYRANVPDGFLESTVGGARCVIRPRNDEIYSILKDPLQTEFSSTIAHIFAPIGAFLNDTQGKIKLTPDFGRFSGLADILARFTPHVLGIRREDGGCGGKTAFSSTGILAALEASDSVRNKDIPVTLIGSAGAMGYDVLAYFLREQFYHIAVCDLQYDKANSKVRPPDMALVLPSNAKTFTDACLSRGGLIVATSIGQELENSVWQLIPGGTILLLAHNLAIPAGESGIYLTRQLANQGVFVLPGQILTLGGALTSRLEWYWRQSKRTIPFDKILAHTIVREVVRYLVLEIQQSAAYRYLSPYEAMLDSIQVYS